MKPPTPPHVSLEVQIQPLRKIVKAGFTLTIPAVYGTHLEVPTNMGSKLDLKNLKKTVTFQWDVLDMQPGSSNLDVRAAYQILKAPVPEHTPWEGVAGLLSEDIVETSFGEHGGEFNLTNAQWQQVKWAQATGTFYSQTKVLASVGVYVRMRSVNGKLPLAKPTSCVHLTFKLLFLAVG